MHWLKYQQTRLQGEGENASLSTRGAAFASADMAIIIIYQHVGSLACVTLSMLGVVLYIHTIHNSRCQRGGCVNFYNYGCATVKSDPQCKADALDQFPIYHCSCTCRRPAACIPLPGRQGSCKSRAQNMHFEWDFTYHNCKRPRSHAHKHIDRLGSQPPTWPSSLSFL